MVVDGGGNSVVDAGAAVVTNSSGTITTVSSTSGEYTVVGPTISNVLATETGVSIVTEAGKELATGAGISTSVLGGFGPIYSGVVEAIGWDRSTAQLTIRDFRLKLQQPVQKNIYTGGGGVDGSPELANVTKPYALGRCRNVRPTLINSARLVYQVHDGEMRSIDSVYDMGVALDQELEVLIAC